MAIITGATELPGVLGHPISTEMAVNIFGIGAGVFGGLAGLVAGQRLTQVAADEIPVGLVLPGLLVAGVSTVIGALLIPTSL